MARWVGLSGRGPGVGLKGAGPVEVALPEDGSQGRIPAVAARCSVEQTDWARGGWQLETGSLGKEMRRQVHLAVPSFHHLPTAQATDANSGDDDAPANGNGSAANGHHDDEDASMGSAAGSQVGSGVGSGRR